ncbi:MAG: DUF1289 domain-containing protein [Burkholderiaceae bacterium]|nr:DUF1289 domain-containing protein [Burkholderiaceae bacterium]
MDASTGLCVGCFRTIEEIARWSQMTDRDKELVLNKLAIRRVSK